jgi:hypothetical protein
MNLTILIIGLGGLGSVLLELLARSSLSCKLIVGSRNKLNGRACCNLAKLGAQAQGYDPDIDFIQLDLDEHKETVQTIQSVSPDIIVCTATRQSWWLPHRLPAPQASRFKSAGFGLWLPLHLSLPTALMRILQSAKYRGHTLIAPFPDVVNCILDRIGLSPTCGIGNVDEIATKLRGLASAKLGTPIDEVTVTLVGHHALEKCAFDGSPEAVPYFLKVEQNGRDVTKEIKAVELLTEPFTLPEGPSTHFLTAGSAVRLITALGSDRSLRLHAPGPNGLPGGYPVLASRSGVTVPEIDGLSLSDAIRINEQSHKFDGIERIEKDGSVVFTEKVVAVARDELGFNCIPLNPHEVETRAQELLSKFQAYAKRFGMRF